MRTAANQQAHLSRRAVFSHAAGLAGGAALISLGVAVREAPAATLMAQKAVSYQDSPKGRARCDGCTQWKPPESCKIVSGVINPAGWCTLYAAKS